MYCRPITYNDLYDPIPLRATLPFGPEWVVGLRGNTNIQDFNLNPNNPRLYESDPSIKAMDKVDLFGNIPVTIAIRIDGTLINKKEYVGDVQWNNGAWRGRLLGDCDVGSYGSKLNTMVALQEMDRERESEIMRIHYSQYMDRLHDTLFAFVNNKRPRYSPQ